MFPSEWHPQSFIQLTWPHIDTDWAPTMNEVVECYCNIAREITLREPLVIIAQKPDEVRSSLREHGILHTNCTIVCCHNNDTWARDHAFLTRIEDGDTLTLLDYQFNGWGMKFAANYDNQINRNIFKALEQAYREHDSSLTRLNAHNHHQRLIIQYSNQLDFVLEGGSIESDGEGTLLTTSSCLLALNRNDILTPQQIEQRLLNDLQSQRLLWLHYGHLEGDDTDGHIDTLARFCPNDTIAYVQCTDTTDSHYDDLKRMEEELQSFRTSDGHSYRLVSLPMPDAMIDEEGERLPATYANFLILSPSDSASRPAILYPTYRQAANDLKAKQQLQLAFPDYDIVGIDCCVLIRQHGSLHCCTMQYPCVR